MVKKTVATQRWLNKTIIGRAQLEQILQLKKMYKANKINKANKQFKAHKICGKS
jgi:hypothetical protein